MHWKDKLYTHTIQLGLIQLLPKIDHYRLTTTIISIPNKNSQSLQSQKAKLKVSLGSFARRDFNHRPSVWFTLHLLWLTNL